MILDLDVSNNSFTKLLALIHDAADALDDEYSLSESHRNSFQMYKIIKHNDKNEFNRVISNYLSRLNSLALSSPYSNQNTLLLIDALHTVTSDTYYYNHLNELFSDIRFIYIPEFCWDDYNEQPAHVYEEPPVSEQELSTETNDFDFDEEVLSKLLTDDETQKNEDDFKNFDFGNDLKPVGENVIKRQNTINEKEVEKRAMAQAATIKANTISERNIEDQIEDDNDDFDFGISPTPTEENKSVKRNRKKELKPWVKPLFVIAGLTLIASLIISWLF